MPERRARSAGFTGPGLLSLDVSATTDDDPLITLDEQAADTIERLLRERDLDPREAGLRLSVSAGGCAGRSYDMDLVAAPDPDDLVTEHRGVRVFVPPENEAELAGSEFALESTAHGTGFTVDNPNAEQVCGCGSSFR